MNCSTDYAAVFIYLLIRDEVSFGKIERILADIEKVGPNKISFSDDLQGAYALKLANRLLWQK